MWYKDGPGNWRYVTTEPIIVRGHVNVGKIAYRYGDENGNIWLQVGPYDRIVVPANYAWDGASPKWKLGPFWLGTPDTPCTARATCIHDVLYQFLHVDKFPYSRKDADTTFFNLLRDDGFKIKGIYHGAVRMFGSLARSFNTERTGRLIEVRK